MAKWFVKDLSKISGVSVQTLHHYDRINLLKPSLRQSNGYRLYSEKDLIRLQQIIALKFFGFELSQIEKLLTGNVDIFEHFEIQAKCLEEKANAFNIASKTLKSIITENKSDKSIPWEKVIKSIEVYHMAKQLENTWVVNALTSEELKQYAEFDADLKKRFMTAEKEAWENSWKNVVKELNDNLSADPKSKKGMELAKKTMDLINGLYGKKYAHLKHSLWVNGFKKGHASSDHSLSPDIISWLDKAIDNYYRIRIYTILDQVDKNPKADVIQNWSALLEEMYGNSNELKHELISAALIDDRVSSDAKKWLSKL